MNLNISIVNRIESNSPRISILHTKNLDVVRDGLVVDMNHFDTGEKLFTSSKVLLYLECFILKILLKFLLYV